MYPIKILLFLLLFPLAFSQESRFRFINFSEKDGISDQFIYSIDQEKSGKIWIGTQSGLYYFDGLKFKNLKSDKDVAGHQISNILQQINVDHSGEIWLSSINALQIYNPSTQKFRNFNYNDKNISSLVSANITTFCDAENQKMWIGTKENFWYVLDKKTGNTQHFIPKSSFINNQSKTIIKILKIGNWFYVISNNGIFKTNLSGEISPIFNVENGKPTKNNFEDAYYDPKSQHIILACGLDGIGTFDCKTEKITYKVLKYQKTDNADSRLFINTIAPKSKNEVWFTAGSLGVYHFAKNQFTIIEPNHKDEFSFRTYNISRLFKDNEQNLWITSYNGISLLPWQNNQIKNIPLYNSFAKYTIEPYGILKDGNQVLIGNNTSNGLLYLNEKNEIQLIENPSLKGQFRTINGIQYLTKTPDHQIFGTSDKNLFKVDVQNKKLIQIPINLQGNLGRIISDNLGNLYISTAENGFYIYHSSTKNLQHFNLWDIDKNIKPNSQNVISARFKDKNGNIWFGKTEGVYQYNPNTKKFLHLATQPAINNTSKITQSNFFAEDYNGNIWISTNDNGVFKLSKDFKIVENFNKENSGLPSDFCGNLFMDKKGFLWIGTLSGLAKFDVNTNKTIAVIHMQNGLKESNSAVPMNFTEDGKVYINHYGALSVLDLETYQENKKVPKTVINSIKIADKEIPVSENIKLKYFQNFITFEWMADALNNFNQNTFAYKLDGVDKNFIETKNNSISYANLEDGTYTFWVKTANNDGIWGNPTKIEFRISPPFWKSWWFYMLLLLITFGIFYAFYFYKTQQIKSEAKLKTKFAQDLADLEMKALRAQMNPHFIFNSLNSIQNYILKNDSDKASQYLTKFSRLIRLILDHSNQNFITLDSEIQLLKLYVEMEDMRFEKHFETLFNIDEKLDTETTLIPSMLIQPSVENAIWHGLLHKNEKGHLKIIFNKLDENLLEVTVEDNGIGRKKAEQLRSKTSLKKKSYGTEITNVRIQNLNKTSTEKTSFEIVDLYDEHENAVGTKVLIKIPTKKCEI